MAEDNNVQVVDATDQAAVDAAAETKQQNQPAGGSGASGERLWTQSEVDAYVKARIDKQNAKHRTEDADKDARIAELEESSKAATAKAEALEHEKQLQEWANEVAAGTGIPAAVLRGDTLEEMQQHAEAIKANLSLYPTTGDNGAPLQPATKTREEIMAMTNDREMLAAIKATLGQSS